MTVLDGYWPSVAHVDACIRTEAETIDDAVLLAVHEPGPLLVRSANGATEETATENDLLDAFMRPANDGSAVLVAITGDSGVGKSHMVRWLHAQLMRHPKRDRLVIVLVPKTASLRQVVERILQPLAGNERYQHLQHDLSKAVDALEPKAASQMLATALAIELEGKYDEGMQALRQAGSQATRDTRARLDLTRVLREILRDSDVFDQWFGAVLQRIVSQTIEGGSESQTGELRRFVPSDLQVPESWAPENARAATAKALHQLTKDEGARCPLAADILQEALDPALRVVFRFSEALGQRTIEEIVDDIRRSLLADDKELVLLIEDFAALAGIQQPLLNLMIAESEHQGQRIRAPLRTALAVTDGFLPSRQTILTRAKREWIIPNTVSDEAALIRRMVGLTGRYLNAARWGIAALQEQLRCHHGSDLYSWVQTFDAPLGADDADLLRAFGKSEHGHALFPLSAPAIASLCRRELKLGTGMRFNPRAFINNVLRDTLLKRYLHETRAFPPAGFKEAVLPSGVELALRGKAILTAHKERLAPVLVHWANNPAELSSPPTVGRGVFQAFDVPWPFAANPVAALGASAVHAASLKPSGSPDLGATSAPPPPKQAAAPAPNLDYLEDWANGNIAQTKARDVRALLAAALNGRVDWNSVRVRSTNVSPNQIWLPFAQTGNPNTEPKFIAAEAVRPVSATLRGGLRALERWQANGKSWDYEKSEDEYGVAQQLLDQLEAQVTAWHVRAAERQASAAARVLHRQALLLRLTKTAEPTAPRLKEYFAISPLQNVEPGGGSNSNNAVTMIAAAVARAQSARPEMQQVLLDAVGCFQGTGKLLYAVDSQRITVAWRTELSDDAAQYIKAEAPLARQAADELLPASRIGGLLTRLRNVVDGHVPTVKALVGDDADVSMVLPLRQHISKIRQAGLFPTGICSASEADKAVDLLGTDEAKSVMRHALSFNPPDPARSPDVQLAGWAVLDTAMLVNVHGALNLLDKVLKESERMVAAQLEAIGGGELGAMVQELQHGLAEVSQEEAGS